VRLLGARPRERLPAYLAHWDVSLMPYLSGDWARHGSPLKLWDYLYAGPPIVATGYEDLREFPPPLAWFAPGREDFLAAVEAALRGALEGREQRRNLALGGSWDARAAELDRAVGERMRKVRAGG
jgi:UDP-galactopyranose mutase